MNLGSGFIIASIGIFALLLPLYIYVKKNKKLPFVKSDLDFFKHEVEIYFTNHHPKIKMDYGIFEKSKSASNDDIEEILVIEDLVGQYVNMPYTFEAQPTPSKEILWTTYEDASIPIKGKLPKDWSRRKELIYRRDEKTCQRCGQKIKVDNAYAGIIKPIEHGGTYHIENLVTLCVDCNRIMKAEEPSKLIPSLQTYDDLIELSNHYS